MYVVDVLYNADFLVSGLNRGREVSRTLQILSGCRICWLPGKTMFLAVRVVS